MEEVLIKWINKLAGNQIENELVVSEVDMNNADSFKPGFLNPVNHGNNYSGYTVSHTILQ